MAARNPFYYDVDSREAHPNANHRSGRTQGKAEVRRRTGSGRRTRGDGLLHRPPSVCREPALVPAGTTDGRPDPQARRAHRCLRCRRGVGGTRRAKAGMARIFRRCDPERRECLLGRSGRPAVRRSQRAFQGVWRVHRTRPRHPADHRRGIAGEDRAQRGHGHPGQPPMGGIPADEPAGRPGLSRCRTRLSRTRGRPRPKDPHRRELRRPHPQHHRRPVADQRRRAQPRGRVEGRDDGMAARRLQGGRKERPARGADFGAHPPCCTGGRNRRVEPCRSEAGRRGHARTLPRRARIAHALRPRCADSRGIRAGPLA